MEKDQEKLNQNPMYYDESCKTMQQATERFGYNMMCAGDEEDKGMVLPASEGCEKQVEVLSKYGVMAVCDEEDDEVAKAADKLKAERDAKKNNK